MCLNSHHPASTKVASTTDKPYVPGLGYVPTFYKVNTSLQTEECSQRQSPLAFAFPLTLFYSSTRHDLRYAWLRHRWDLETMALLTTPMVSIYLADGRQTKMGTGGVMATSQQTRLTCTYQPQAEPSHLPDYHMWTRCKALTSHIFEPVQNKPNETKIPVSVQ